MHPFRTPLAFTLILPLALTPAAILASGTLEFSNRVVEVDPREGNDFVLPVERNDSTRGEVTVDYSFVAGTAEAGSDYSGAGGTLLLKNGADSAEIPVNLLQDQDPEHTETFTVVLSNPTGGATLGANTAVLVRIRDNDWADEDTIHRINIGCYDIPVHADPRTGEPSGPPPIPVSVAGVTHEVIGVRVKVSDLSHSGPGDLDLILEGPRGQFCKLMSDYGATERGAREPASRLNLCFDDNGPKLDPSDRLSSGIYHPFDHERGDDLLLDRTQVGSSGTEALAVFNGLDPNGTWRLHVVDDFQGTGGNPPHYIGKLLGGWELILILKPIILLPVISEVRNLNVVTVAFFFTGPANETFVWERATPESGGWEFVRDVTTLGENQLQQLNSSKNGFPTAIYRFRNP